MKKATRCFSALICLTMIVGSVSLANAQTTLDCPEDGSGGPPPAVGGPSMAWQGLGVRTSTVEVDVALTSRRSTGPQTRVVDGYGEAVYGQRVDQIAPGSAAFDAGLEVGDVLVNANGYPMDEPALLDEAVEFSEGYMEMQVVDVRSGNLSWVVAEPQVPYAAQVTNTSARRRGQNLQRSRTDANRSNRRNGQQAFSTNQNRVQRAQRKPPTRRRRGRR